MQKTENKTTNSVKSKLVAAIAMLLVATIMVVSSTYAWFTLSTKPEVTGISTAVGANGALEIALARYNGTTFEQLYGELDTNTSEADRNLYWGNLVNLGLAEYGSDRIVLYPSKLNTNVDGTGIVLGAPIETPFYGPDGRVERLLTGGMFGKYNDGSFIEDKNYYGFRALGVASGLTERQQAFRAALAQITVYQSSAQSEARTSLAANGGTLAAIAIKHAMNNGKETYGDANGHPEKDAITAMIAGLEKALADIENAYLETVYATINGNSSGLADDDAVKTALAAAKGIASDPKNSALGAKIAAIITKGSITAEKLSNYTKFTTAVANLATAKTALNLVPDTGATWAQLRAALEPLVDITKIKVNDILASEINTEANKNKIASDVGSGKGINVAMPTGAGVYADIADYTGNYTVAIKIDTTPLNTGINIEVDATMKTATTETTPIFNAIKTTVGADTNYPTGDGTIKPITEFYGYVMDLAFKTNASTSNLLLQTAPADRIYKGNQNEKTAGKGSTMTFSTTDPTFTKSDMLRLAGNIKIVFYDTTTGKIYATAKLDTAENKVTETADGYRANIHIEGENGLITEEKDAKITALDPNVAKYISALVYLDGENITNGDVSAIAQSLTGTLNLQFASSAELLPMEYSDLHTVAPAADDDDSTDNG